MNTDKRTHTQRQVRETFAIYLSEYVDKRRHRDLLQSKVGLLKF